MTTDDIFENYVLYTRINNFLKANNAALLQYFLLLPIIPVILMTFVFIAPEHHDLKWIKLTCIAASMLLISTWLDELSQMLLDVYHKQGFFYTSTQSFFTKLASQFQIPEETLKTIFFEQGQSQRFFSLRFAFAPIKTLEPLGKEINALKEQLIMDNQGYLTNENIKSIRHYIKRNEFEQQSLESKLLKALVHELLTNNAIDEKDL